MSSTGSSLPMLVLEDNDPETRRRLRAKLGHLSWLSIEKVRRLDSNAGRSCDAVYLSFMLGLDYGAKAELGRAQVIATNEIEQGRGLPRYFVVGVAWDPTSTPGTAAQKCRQNLRSIVRELSAFLSQSSHRMHTLCAQAEGLFGHEIQIDEAAAILEEEWPA
jgi:hypothetical protein